MNYDDFKKELLRALLDNENSVKKRICLFEKDKISEEQDFPMRLIVDCVEECVKGVRFHEDILCFTRKIHGQQRFLYWEVPRLYERFRGEGWQGILPELFYRLKQWDAYEEQGSSSGQLIVKPVCCTLNRYLMEDSVYWKFGDIAFVLYLLVGEDENEHIVMRVTREQAKRWNVPEEILLKNAMLHTCSKMSLKIKYSTQSKGYRLTDANGMNGVLLFFYPGVKEDLAKLLAGDYYVGFLNADEVAVYPVQQKILGELKRAMFKEEFMLEERQWLSDRLYRYSCSHGRLIEV